jgi:hypothetical protein
MLAFATALPFASVIFPAIVLFCEKTKHGSAITHSSHIDRKNDFLIVKVLVLINSVKKKSLLKKKVVLKLPRNKICN